MANFHHIAFGFLGGKEVQAAGLGSLGLRDRKPPYNFPFGILTPCRTSGPSVGPKNKVPA